MHGHAGKSVCSVYWSLLLNFFHALAVCRCQNFALLQGRDNSNQSPFLGPLWRVGCIDWLWANLVSLSLSPPPRLLAYAHKQPHTHRDEISPPFLQIVYQTLKRILIHIFICQTEFILFDLYRHFSFFIVFGGGRNARLTQTHMDTKLEAGASWLDENPNDSRSGCDCLT